MRTCRQKDDRSEVFGRSAKGLGLYCHLNCHFMFVTICQENGANFSDIVSIYSIVTLTSDICLLDFKA
jgi:hypothetical protein